MTKLTQITANDVRAIEAELKQAFDAIGQKYGIAFETPSLRYNSTMFRGKVEARLNSAAESLAKVQQHVVASSGMLPVGTVFRVRETEYTVTKIHPSRPKNCYDVTTHNGTKYRCGKDFVSEGTIIKR